MQSAPRAAMKTVSEYQIFAIPAFRSIYMNRFFGFGIGTRLGTGFGFLLLLMLALAQYSVT